MDDIFSIPAVSDYVERCILEGEHTDAITPGDAAAWIRGSDLTIAPVDDHGSLNQKIVARNAKIEKLVETTSVPCDPVAQHRVDLRSMEWQWILCYGPFNTVDFEDLDDVTVLSGRNGSGKTALLETVIVAMFGQESPCRASKGDPCSLLNKSTPAGSNAWTSLVFSADGVSYKIRREFQSKSGKLSQVATVIDNSSGMILETGRSNVDKWVSNNVGDIGGFLLGCIVTQANDMDFLSMKPADQKAMIDTALRPRETLVSALSESRKSHKWLADCLEAAAESCSVDDAEDERLESLFRLTRDLSRQRAIEKSKLRFLRVVQASRNKRRKQTSRLNELREALAGEAPPVAGSVSERSVCEVEEELEAYERKARELQREKPVNPGRMMEGDRRDALEIKVEKYGKASELVKLIQNAGPYNDSCWACKKRCGEGKTEELAALNVGTDASVIEKKLRGYEKRLRACIDKERLDEWSAMAKACESERLSLSEEARRLRIAMDSRELASLEESAGTEDASGELASLKKVAELKRELSKSVASASRELADATAKRRAANASRLKGARLAERLALVRSKHAAMKAVEGTVKDYYERVYKGVIEESLVAKTNGILEGTVSGRVSAKWSDKGFSFWIDDLPVEKACGLHKACYGLALRIAVSEMGIGATRTNVLFLDEAFSAMDSDHIGKIPNLMRELSARFGRVVLVTHDESVHSMFRNLAIDDSDGHKSFRH